MLSCDDENCRATEELQEKITFFVCHECGGHEQGRVVGGDRRYAISLVKREVLREIRTGEYIATMKAFKDAALVEKSEEEEILEEPPQSKEVLEQETKIEEATREVPVVEEVKKDGI